MTSRQLLTGVKWLKKIFLSGMRPDGVHFGSDSDLINRGAKLYTKTIKEAIEKADKAPVGVVRNN